MKPSTRSTKRAQYEPLRNSPSVDDLQADILLKLKHITDALILDLCKLGVINCPRRVITEGLPQRRRA